MNWKSTVRYFRWIEPFTEIQRRRKRERVTMLRILDWKIETSVSIEFLPHKKGKFPYVNESLDSQRPFMVSRFFLRIL